jgi:dimeric dUTPase (all-alpha-NTP-PPase superfamily)
MNEKKEKKVLRAMTKKELRGEFAVYGQDNVRRFILSLLVKTRKLNNEKEAWYLDPLKPSEVAQVFEEYA